MKKHHTLLVLLLCNTSLLFAETSALLEVKHFKTWVIKGEQDFFNLAIKNTGTEPFLLAKNMFEFSTGQLFTRALDNKWVASTGVGFSYDTEYGHIKFGDGFEPLPVGETRVFDGRKFRLVVSEPFSEKMQYKVSVYLGNNFWLDSEPLTFNGVTPDLIEELATLKDNKTKNVRNPPRELMAVTYKNERWLHIKSISGSGSFSVCPLSLTNKIRVEPHDGGGLFKIWDGDKSMIFDMYKIMLIEGSDENDVYGKWTRERKQKAEADNAEVRRKKQEAGN